MDSEVLSTYDVEMLYGKLEEKDDFLRTIYSTAFPGLIPMEDYFSEKKKKMKKCSWIRIGEHGCCGELCKDVFCDKHL